MNAKKTIILGLLLTFAMGINAQVGIGTNSPDASAILDVDVSSLGSNEKLGFLPPRMNTSERDAINGGAPASGLVIYNTDEGCLQVNVGSPATPDWACIGGSSAPSGEELFPAIVDTTLCLHAAQTGDLAINVAASGVSFDLPYTNGNGGIYFKDSIDSRVGFGNDGVVGGMTARLSPAGYIDTGSGSLTYTVSGTPTQSGTAFFDITLGEKTCTQLYTVPSPLTSACASATISTTPCSSVSGTTVNDDVATQDGVEYDWTGATTSGAANTTTTRALVDIGGQCWMRYNMEVAPSTGRHTVHTSRANPDEGRLYNWIAAMNGATAERSQGICPTGFHVPSDCEWKQLESYLGMNISDQDIEGVRRGEDAWIGSKIKDLSARYLVIPGGIEDTNATNMSGFSALVTSRAIWDTGNPFFGIPAQMIYDTYPRQTYFWTSTPAPSSQAWARELDYHSALQRVDWVQDNILLSLRCLAD